MKIDITSMFFNSRIEGQTATPAWGTSIGQNKSRACRIDDFKSEVVDMVIGMTYKSVADIDKLDVSKGSGNRDIITCSVFEDVYINNKKIDNTQYVLLLVREHSKSHDGRLLISYAPYIKYNGIENQSCIDLMRQLLGCSTEGCWFVYDISIKNQSELYFSAVVVNPSSPMVYSNSIKSKNRSEEWKALIPTEEETESCITNGISDSLQQIFYGAPGTGKSNTIKCEVDQKDLPRVRTTFHPDSDYSTFVGAYKPTMEEVDVKTVPVVIAGGITLDQNKGTYKEKKISYKFVKQAFLKAYVKAWKLFKESCADGQELKPQFLIIEEINRGNCAQIFGDLFQLLDRKQNFSEYPVEADADICKALQGEETENNPSFGAGGLQLTDEQKTFINNVYDGKPVAEKICKGEVLVLPPNLYIWATMNTSDQSLFPMDSAFKRRWDWQYMPITNAKLRWKIELSEIYVKIDWWEFLKRINKVVADLTTSEDKQLGYFFCQPDSFINSENKSHTDKYDLITAKHFVDKVIFYLWNDVFKDYAFDASCCKDGNGKEVLFAQFYNEDGKSVNTETLKHFFETLQSENELLSVEEIPTKKQDKPEAE